MVKESLTNSSSKDLTNPEWELVKIFRNGMKMYQVLDVGTHPNKDEILEFVKYCIDYDVFKYNDFRLEISDDYTKIRKLPI